MTGAKLTHAWLVLLALSAVSTLVSIAVSQGILSGYMATTGGAAILMLGWVKACIILSRYLGLNRAPSWLRGFETVLVFYSLLLLCFYLAAQ
ncbi:MAG: nitric oxide reductase F protein [Amylibacter sp.]|nr:nitric oxide reductase F protein [Amylibacter sp.]